MQDICAVGSRYVETLWSKNRQVIPPDIISISSSVSLLWSHIFSLTTVDYTWKCPNASHDTWVEGNGLSQKFGQPWSGEEKIVKVKNCWF